jgi:protein phosphatase
VIPIQNAHLNVAAATHPGLRDKANEDRYSVLAYRLSSDDRTPSVLALLADGIGGHRAGEVAAELAVKVINDFVTQAPSSPPTQIIAQALIHASQVILSQSKSDPLLNGMGTTCVCAWVIGDQLYAASMGDSRLYLQRGAKIMRLTTDHTWIQDALTQGTLTPEQAKGHPNSHIIRRFLGSANAINPDLRLRLSPEDSDIQAVANQGLHLLPGDHLVLTSDGLTDLVTDTEILEILRTIHLESAPTHLIDLANQRGGHDNITVVALEVPQPSGFTRPFLAKPKPKNAASLKGPRTATSWLMVILVLVAILMLVFLLVYSFMQ